MKKVLVFALFFLCVCTSCYTTKRSYLTTLYSITHSDKGQKGMMNVTDTIVYSKDMGYPYKDSLLSISFSSGGEAINFFCENETTSPIKLLWNSATLVGMHEKTPVVLGDVTVNRGALDQSAYGVYQLQYTTTVVNESSGMAVSVVSGDTPASGSIMPLAHETINKWIEKNAVKSTADYGSNSGCEGKHFNLLLPVIHENKTHLYNFEFVVSGTIKNRKFNLLGTVLCASVGLTAASIIIPVALVGSSSSYY
jgi:hypothetical protein